MTTTSSMLPSYDHGANDRPLLGETIGENFNRMATAHADREALADLSTGRRWTYAELHHDVLALAHGLLRLGIGKGDRVGIWAPTCPEWMLLQYATAEIGAILVPINPAYRADELAYVVQQAGIRLLVAAPSFRTSDVRQRKCAGRLRQHMRDKASTGGRVGHRRIPPIRPPSGLRRAAPRPSNVATGQAGLPRRDRQHHDRGRDLGRYRIGPCRPRHPAINRVTVVGPRGPTRARGMSPPLLPDPRRASSRRSCASLICSSSSARRGPCWSSPSRSSSCTRGDSSASSTAPVTYSSSKPALIAVPPHPAGPLTHP